MTIKISELTALQKLGNTGAAPAAARSWDFAYTWTVGATEQQGMYVNFTDTASHANSSVARWDINGVNLFNWRKTGVFEVGAFSHAAGSVYSKLSNDFGPIDRGYLSAITADTEGPNSISAFAGNADTPAVKLFVKSRGTFAAPTTVVNADSIGTMQWLGYDGTAFVWAAIDSVIVTGAVSAGVVPADRVFSAGGSAGGFVEAMRIKDSGVLQFPTTITAGGTTGNQTINKTSGTVNVAAAGTTVTVTCNKCTASSLVFAVIRTADATAVIKNVVPGAGSFVINLVGATAEVSIGFWVLNS